MNFGFPDKTVVERIREYYPTGARVELEYMNDPYTRIPPGTLGTVVAVDDIGTIHVRWDTGVMLGVAYGADKVQRISV